MKSKKFVAILICIVMMLAVVTACNKDTGNTNSDSNTNDNTQSNNSSNTQDNTQSNNNQNSQDNTQSNNNDNSANQGDNQQNPAPAGVRDTLNIAIPNDSGSLDAANSTGATFGAVTCIMEPLWDITDDGDILYILAESVDIVAPDEWILHLRQGVKFSNGNDFTADDVYFSIMLHYNAGATGGPRVQTVDVNNMEVIDDYTFRLKLWDYHVANWTVLSMMIVYDAESYDPEVASNHPIGTGPYVLTDYVINSHLSLELRDEYWGEMPTIKYLNFRVLAEPSQVVNSLATGAIDIGSISTPDVSYVSTMPNYFINSRYTGNYVLLGFNFGVNSFFYHNLDARRAVVHAVDPQVIVDLVYEGQGEVMKCVVPKLCFDYEERFENMDDTYSIGYNVELAKQLAESSGLAGQTVTIMTDGTPTQVLTAEIVQNMLQAIGVTAQILSFDGATVWQMLYDPASVWDMSIGAGMAPNRRVGDLLVNGVRYSPTLTAPGAFNNNDYYLQIAPLTLSTADDAQRSEYLYEVLKMYIENVLNFSLCDVLYSTAISTDIDPSSITYTFGTAGIRIQTLKFK
ncbi:MAG: ABC transporter substrate-binding protein [Oscillospiraceae bacterium]|nr:ABC transporter substrate-binding protein [Oscillospiraceae bacterium]